MSAARACADGFCRVSSYIRAVSNTWYIVPPRRIQPILKTIRYCCVASRICSFSPPPSPLPPTTTSPVLKTIEVSTWRLDPSTWPLALFAQLLWLSTIFRLPAHVFCLHTRYFVTTGQRQRWGSRAGAAGAVGRSSGWQMGHSSLLGSHRIAYWSQDQDVQSNYFCLEGSRELAIHIFA